MNLVTYSSQEPESHGGQSQSLFAVGDPCKGLRCCGLVARHLGPPPKFKGFVCRLVFFFLSCSGGH